MTFTFEIESEYAPVALDPKSTDRDRFYVDIPCELVNYLMSAYRLKTRQEALDFFQQHIVPREY
jgi:hypothetical protein